MPQSSLSSVVSSLVRAQVGSSVPDTVTDEELDRHVAELIRQEAKQKAEKYLQEGVSAYLPTKGPDNLPVANKRFLSTVIRSTDEHNKAILRAQAEAAREAKAEIDEQKRRERRARALEATDAERLRRLMRGSVRQRDVKWNRHRDGHRDSRRRGTFDHHDEATEYEGEHQDHKRRSRCHSRSRSPDGKEDDSDRHQRRRHRDREEAKEGSSSRTHRRHSRPISAESESHRSTHEQGRSRRRERREECIEMLNQSKGKGKEIEEHQLPSTSSSRNSTLNTPREDVISEVEDGNDLDPSRLHSRRSPSASRKASSADLSAQFKARKAKLASTPPPPPSPTLSEEEDIERYRPRKRRRAAPDTKLVDLPPSHPGKLPSKMDKYFEESYDPRLDTGPLTVPNIPSTGLIEDASFEAWEAMLDVIRQRREDKAERKRLERLGLLPDKKVNDKDSKVLKDSEAWGTASGTAALDIKYNKRGTVREWDLGKTGF